MTYLAPSSHWDSNVKRAPDRTSFFYFETLFSEDKKWPFLRRSAIFNCNFCKISTVKSTVSLYHLKWCVLRNRKIIKTVSRSIQSHFPNKSTTRRLCIRNWTSYKRSYSKIFAKTWPKNYDFDLRPRAYGETGMSS